MYLKKHALLNSQLYCTESTSPIIPTNLSKSVLRPLVFNLFKTINLYGKKITLNNWLTLR